MCGSDDLMPEIQFIEAGCDLIGVGDAICSQIDKDSYDLYIKDRHTELIEYIHNRGASVKLHICGDITHLLESIKDINTDLIDLDWQVDIDYAREILGNEVVLGGNINPVVVQEKSADEVFHLSKVLVEKYKDQKYLLAAGCEITLLTPQENLMSMSRATRL